MNNFERDLAYKMIEAYSMTKTRGEFVKKARNISGGEFFDKSWLELIWEILDCAAE